MFEHQPAAVYKYAGTAIIGKAHVVRVVTAFDKAFPGFAQQGHDGRLKPARVAGSGNAQKIGGVGVAHHAGLYGLHSAVGGDVARGQKLHIDGYPRKAAAFGAGHPIAAHHHVLAEAGRSEMLTKQVEFFAGIDADGFVEPGFDTWFRPLKVAGGHFIHLVPCPPLPAIHRAEVTLSIFPLIPDAYPVGFQIGRVGISLEKPQQLVDNALQMHLFGGDEREALREIKPHLRAENGYRAGAGTVGFHGAGIEDLTEEGLVLAHKKPKVKRRLRMPPPNSCSALADFIQ